MDLHKTVAYGTQNQTYYLNLKTTGRFWSTKVVADFSPFLPELTMLVEGDHRSAAPHNRLYPCKLKGI